MRQTLLRTSKLTKADFFSAPSLHLGLVNGIVTGCPNIKRKRKLESGQPKCINLS